MGNKGNQTNPKEFVPPREGKESTVDLDANAAIWADQVCLKHTTRGPPVAVVQQTWCVKAVPVINEGLKEINKTVGGTQPFSKLDSNRKMVCKKILDVE